ncbi:MAG TPA: cyclic dehypoxanthinyl futalosine synthase [Acidobacteriota bacterium]|nr:cyclic dehypoxanthinyl futalosine synthase [Acidobacteriota bacterium]
MRTVKSILDKVYQGGRITSSQALALMESEGALHEIGKAADYLRWQKHPRKVVSFLIDRNINYTNVCVARCTFCNFYRKPRHEEGYLLPTEEICKKVEETVALGGTGILMQGGMNPDLKIDYYEDLLRTLRERFPNVHLHCFSPPEVVVLAKLSKLTLRQAIRRLRDAGLDSIPGGGAEILTDRSRKEISPGKCSSQEWLEVMRIAHQEGLTTTATMMVGSGESLRERVEHLQRIRELQDETGGFVAFIPWNVQLEGTPMSQHVKEEMGPVEYLKLLAICRIFLDNIENIQVSWLTQGLQVGQMALFFGANDVGSIMIEENVISTAGANYKAEASDLIKLVEEAGFTPLQRDTLYRTFRKIA